MNQQNKSYKVLGLMSGTSLDGIDLCLTEFKHSNNKWSFKIIKAKTVKYNENWKTILQKVETSSAEILIQTHFSYGAYLGKVINSFINKHNLKVDSVASHGHTIFHQIENGFTFQLGNGASIAAETNLLTISDFRTFDVALGGQGAPLVPFGDKQLFSEFNCCINLGGFINLSFTDNQIRKAYDVAPINIVINHLMRKHYNLDYDDCGEKSKTGSLNSKLFNKLNNLEFYQQNGPKSLGKEWVLEKVLPLIEQAEISIEDKLYTFTYHAAFQLAENLKKYNCTTNNLVTGGGVYNTFFINHLKSFGIEFTIPSKEIIEYKEALIFSFLGLKRQLGETNILKSVTGARKNSSSGVCYYP